MSSALTDGTRGMKHERAWLMVALLSTLMGCKSAPAPFAEPTAMQPASAGNVGCFGRILPENGTFFVSPYVVNSGAPVVASVDVKAGDIVSRGQPLAVLASEAYLQGTAAAAETKVRLSEAKLARARIATSPDELAAQQQEINRLQAKRDQSARILAHNKTLFDQDFLSKTKLDDSATDLKQADAALKQAQEHWRAQSDALPEDVAVAEAELKVARSELARTRQDAASGIVRSPSHAEVLRVTAHAGEPVGPEGIAELAELGHMEVVAEVYEADIARVHIGQRADITSEILPGPLHGTVKFIGSEIEKPASIATEPGAPADARIFKVDIQMADQSVLANRINGKVKVVIQP